MKKIIDEKRCTGCSACKNICPKDAISMIEKYDGFCVPQIDENKCINCGMCRKVCPVLNIKKEKNGLPKSYACMNKNEQIRMESSSGGIFTLIAEEILKENGIIFGASFNENLELNHVEVQNKEDLKFLRGSKYLQSNIGNTFKIAENYLKQNRKVLFTGTPCQIEGLKSFLRKDYDNLYTQDIICHGVPSKKVFEKYVDENKVKKIYFRDKENEGWNNYQILIKTNDSQKYINHEKDLFMRFFLSDIALRESCYECKFKKKHRVSDITLADFWGIDEVLPEMNDEKGTSLVMVHSKKGREIFEKIKDEIIFKEVDFYDSIKYNQSMIKSCKYNENREIFFADLDKFSLKKLCEKYIIKIKNFEKM